MTPKLTIVAKIVAKPGSEELVERELMKLIEPTRGEAGCLQYDLHRSLEEPCVFLFFEIWESRHLWDAHMQTPHIAALQAATSELIEQLELLQMEQIG